RKGVKYSFRCVELFYISSFTKEKYNGIIPNCKCTWFHVRWIVSYNIVRDKGKSSKVVLIHVKQGSKKREGLAYFVIV
ncbi:hypothetical protein, partial [Veillonella magna]|uniref:hypothetical protein n=1 Tax=Veillonella magna TaxID=464322 RepID=UPI002666444A